MSQDVPYVQGIKNHCRVQARNSGSQNAYGEGNELRSRPIRHRGYDGSVGYGRTRHLGIGVYVDEVLDRLFTGLGDSLRSRIDSSGFEAIHNSNGNDPSIAAISCLLR